jgi:hypothetical protein
MSGNVKQQEFLMRDATRNKRLIWWCESERERIHLQLEILESGKMRLGSRTAAKSWEDITAQQSAGLKDKLRELDLLLRPFCQGGLMDA